MHEALSGEPNGVRRQTRTEMQEKLSNAGHGEVLETFRRVRRQLCETVSDGGVGDADGRKCFQRAHS